MGFEIRYFVILCVTTMILLPTLCYCDDGFYYSRATYYGSPECFGTATGACGFGDYGKTINNGEVSGVSRLFRNGTGCGACYQVRCKIPVHCTEEGTNIVVTDHGAGDHTDFILSERAYAKMAQPNMASAIFAYGVVDVEYKRIPCKYDGYNLVLKINEHSRYPHYLAFVTLYQAGVYDITAAEIWLEDCKEWRAMRKPYGAVWDMENPPKGALNLRFQVNAYGYGEPKWVQLANVIPDQWTAGVTYDTTIQLN